MITDLKHYIYHQKQFFDKKLCAETVSEINRLKFEEHIFYNANTKKSESRSGDQELSVLYNSTSDAVSSITKGLWQSLYNYQEFIDMPWFSGWQGYSGIRFNKYMKNKRMALHCDHIHSLFDGERKGIPVLSVLGALNDDYEGGEFIMFDDYKIPLKTGDVVIFPSVFLYPHKVEPVKKGTRYTYISWVW
jgi:hypothetical protein|tara:strand:+ start:40 stop:609 length:570 start_codon:yes stop_codon:yes gene_type:complete